tara:strand:+ start:5603 stop:5791 length:189 start_codon:yes stop_codon:yes gene_type:complete
METAPPMDHCYIEYHRIIESFALGQLIEEGLPASYPDECPDCQRQMRMKLAFINVLREEMQD